MFKLVQDQLKGEQVIKRKLNSVLGLTTTDKPRTFGPGGESCSTPELRGRANSTKYGSDPPLWNLLV